MIIKKIKKAAKRAKGHYKKLVEQPVEEVNIEHAPPKNDNGGEKRSVEFNFRNLIKSVLIIIALAGLAWAVILVKETIFLFFVAFLFAAALDPLVDKLEKYKIPRGLSVIVIFIILISVIVVFIGSLIPIIRNESANIVRNISQLIERLATGEVNFPVWLDFLEVQLQASLSGIDTSELFNVLSSNSGDIAIFGGEVVGVTFKTIGALFAFILSAALVLLLTYFFTVDEKSVDKFIHSLFPSKYGSYINKKTIAVKSKIGQWLRGQVLLIIAVGVSVYIGLLILGVDYAFTLALFAGLTELIPVIGPWIGWLAALPIAANDSATTMLWVTILYFLIQQIENNIFVPLIMKKATGLNPIIVLFAMAVGFELAGILGIVIAIPTTAAISIFLHDYMKNNHNKEEAK